MRRLLPPFVALAVLAGTGAALADKDETTLVSRQSDSAGGAGAGADGDYPGGWLPSISDDGRFVAFQSSANNLSTEDMDDTIDVFVRDLQTGVTTLVSRQSTADGGAAGDADSQTPSISGDGRYVAFASFADNLSDDDTDGDGNGDVFLRDLQAGTTTLVSRANGADGAGGDSNSAEPAISADGRYIAFSSIAENFSDVDQTATQDVFMRDTQDNVTTLVSRQSFPGRGTDEGADDNAAANGFSGDPSISRHGRHVAFVSFASNLSTYDSDSVNDVFVRDNELLTTTLVSIPASDGVSPAVASTDDSGNPSISGDGLLVAFDSAGDELSPADDDDFSNVFLRDTYRGNTYLISRQSGTGMASGAADGASGDPSMSDDGRSIAFTSIAKNLSGDDADGASDVFLRNLDTDLTTLVSRQSAADGGAAADGHSLWPSVSGDGRFVAFMSEATNLSDSDVDLAGTPPFVFPVRDVFVRDVLGPGTSSGTNPGTNPGSPGNNPSQDPTTVVPTGKLRVALKALNNGVVTATFNVPGPGDLGIALLAKASALTSATRTVTVGRYGRRVTKAGAVKVKLRLKGRGKRTLQRKHRLRVTVKSTFKPAGGGMAITARKPVTFRLRR